MVFSDFTRWAVPPVIAISRSSLIENDDVQPFGGCGHRHKFRVSHGEFDVDRGLLRLRFILVQGKNDLIVVVSGEFRVGDDRPLRGRRVGNGDAALVDLYLVGVDLVRRGSPVVDRSTFDHHDVRDIERCVAVVDVENHRAVGDVVDDKAEIRPVEGRGLIEEISVLVAVVLKSD